MKNTKTMRRFIALQPLLLAVLFILTSCRHSREDLVPDTERQTGTVEFQVANYEQFEYEDMTRAMTITDLAHLDMAVYDSASHELVTHIHKVPADAGYGKFSTTLPYGSYYFVFLGYVGTKEAIVDDIEGICFEEDFVAHTFYKLLQVNVSKSQTNTQSVILTRCVAEFNLKLKGGIPSDMGKLTISSNGGSHHLNALTGKGKEVEPRSYTYNAAGYAGKDTLSVNFYSYLTGDEATMDFTATAYNQSQSIIRSREFTNVPMKINQRTIYSGNFFDDDHNFQITVDNTEWDTEEFTY